MHRDRPLLRGHRNGVVFGDKRLKLRWWVVRFPPFVLAQEGAALFG